MARTTTRSDGITVTITFTPDEITALLRTLADAGDAGVRPYGVTDDMIQTVFEKIDAAASDVFPVCEWCGELPNAEQGPVVASATFTGHTDCYRAAGIGR